MIISEDRKRLLFACECVSSRSGYSDPWAGIAQNNLLPDGTKEKILNLVAEKPKTIAQLAKSLKLSQPSVHTHINEMMKSELLRESEEWEKRYPTERYYEPNFPVVKQGERAEFEKLCREMAERVASLFEKNRPRMERAFRKTDLKERGWEFPDIAQYLYAHVQRGARQILEERGSLPAREKHKNGAEWIFWAEETEANGDK
ncbi:MAG TPA: winged helix-turn-helix domain-containing protein [Pyrinomonadaceae bacterium]|nr:winged helix-turn-helix domain-containing protein [Pyrinomonadaceae bacterium]